MSKLRTVAAVTPIPVIPESDLEAEVAARIEQLVARAAMWRDPSRFRSHGDRTAVESAAS